MYLQEHAPDEICISSVTYAELVYGVEKSRAIEKNRVIKDKNMDINKVNNEIINNNICDFSTDKYGKFGVWTILSDNSAYRRSDKTFFNYQVTSVAEEVLWFFGISELPIEQSVNITLVFEGEEYEAYIRRNTNVSKTPRLHFLSRDLKIILSRYNTGTNYPICRFDKVDDKKYSISFTESEETLTNRNRESVNDILGLHQEPANLEEAVVNVDICKYGKNMILYGPPGTGKTYSSAKYAVAICDGLDVDDLDDYDAVMNRYHELMFDENRIAFTTFHQSYGYEEFIEGIKPVMHTNKSDDSGEIRYDIVDGVFKAFCKDARAEQTKPFVFVIDEINRGNISKIFGELITLIEETKREGKTEAASAILPYTKKEFGVPNNVYILGTMNTADRSIALMDTALRRRFQFVEMMPNKDVLKKIGADKVMSDGVELDVSEMLSVINERIEYLYDREHTIGHAFFTGLKDSPTIDKLAEIFKKSIIPLLQEYFYEDYEKIRLVLGDNAKIEVNTQFVLAESIPDDIFEGDVSDEIDIPDKKYKIEYDNFKNIMAYKGISGRL